MKLSVNELCMAKMSLTFDATDIAREVYNRAICDADNKYDAKDKLYEALCDEMIWTRNQWTIMAEYQSPDEADYNLALDRFYDDLWKYFDDVIDEEDE